MAVRRGRGHRAMRQHRAGLVLQEDVNEAQKKAARQQKHAMNLGLGLSLLTGGILGGLGAPLWAAALGSGVATATGGYLGANQKQFDDITKELDEKTYYGYGQQREEVASSIGSQVSEITDIGGHLEKGAMSALTTLVMGGITKAGEKAFAAKEAAKTGADVAEYSTKLSDAAINDIVLNNQTAIEIGDGMNLTQMMKDGDIASYTDILDKMPGVEVADLKEMVIDSAIGPNQRLASAAEAWQGPKPMPRTLKPGEIQWSSDRLEYADVRPTGFTGQTIQELQPLQQSAELRQAFIEKPFWTVATESLKAPTDYSAGIHSLLGLQSGKSLLDAYKTQADEEVNR